MADAIGVLRGMDRCVRPRREMHGMFEDFVDQRFIDGGGAGREAIEQGVVGQAIDNARRAP